MYIPKKSEYNNATPEFIDLTYTTSGSENTENQLGHSGLEKIKGKLSTCSSFFSRPTSKKDYYWFSCQRGYECS